METKYKIVKYADRNGTEKYSVFYKKFLIWRRLYYADERKFCDTIEDCEWLIEDAKQAEIIESWAKNGRKIKKVETIYV